MSDWPYSLFFGDLHNHNALGYGLGSLERSIEIAKSHLDFFAFTGHSSWHDMPSMEGKREQRWIDGFARLKQAWPQVQQLTVASNRDNEFVSFLGFEWHSSMFGDQCVVLPDDFHPLVFPKSIADLRAYCLERNGLMIPHHLAYKTGHRGVNWDVFDDACSPVVEIYSEHGNAETDRGPYDYFNHSMGGRVTSNTAHSALENGLKFGFVASSDNHRGFPGAYGEGLLGVWADELTRGSIFSAIQKRRTIALTGDRIGVQCSVEGHPLGSRIRASREVEVHFAVDGRDEIDVVEIIANGRIVHRIYPEPEQPQDFDTATRQVRFEWGWGPWVDMDLDRICDWDFDLTIADGKILGYSPCFQSGPFDEDRRHRVTKTERRIQISSYTGRHGAYRQNPNQSIVMDIEGASEADLTITMRQPVTKQWTVPINGLRQSSEMLFTGPFPAESCLLHRLVPLSQSSLSGRTTVSLPAGDNYIYLRVRQRNGQMAWASPIFVSVE